MSILSGYGKFKRYLLTDDGYRLCSQWTSSNTVEFENGNTAETNLGAIHGITDSLTATSSNVALSAAAGKNLQDQITGLNTGMTFVVNPLLENITITRQHCIKTGNIVIGSIEFNSSKEIPGIIPIISDLPSPAIAYTGIVQFVSLGTAISYLGYTANHCIYASTNMPSGIYTVSFIYNC